jgi:hypothetical protein
MDILFLLIPLSVALALLILGALGGPCGVASSKTSTPRASAFFTAIDFRQVDPQACRPHWRRYRKGA